MSSDETILVQTSDATVVHRGGPKELKTEILSENLNLFLKKMEKILEKTPNSIGDFRLTEFSVSAEIAANGKLVLLGSGAEVAAQGSLNFKFERKPQS